MNPSDRAVIKLVIDEVNLHITVEKDQIERFYTPIVDWLAHPTDSARRLVAIAGPPGAGKSTFAAILAALINRQAGLELAVAIGQDGWHYPNAYLEQHGLRWCKGAPETFDVTAMADTLRRMKAGQDVAYPVYSRKAHEPAPDRGRVTGDQKIILVEGNYLLLEQAPWSVLQPVFDRTIMLAAPHDVLLANLRARHARGGKAPTAIQRQLEQVDIPNIGLVLEHSSPADLLVKTAAAGMITQITFLTQSEKSFPQTGTILNPMPSPSPVQTLRAPLGGNLRSVCVYAGSSGHVPQAYLDAARQLGAAIARAGLRLVYGAGKTGLMGALADGTIAAGGKVTGVIPVLMNEPHLVHNGLTSLEVAADMHTRKSRMYELADAFIALPGGYGTFDELFETLTWAQIGLHTKPVGLLNVDHYFDPLVAMVDRAVQDGFIHAEYRGLLLSADTPAGLLSQLSSYTPPTDMLTKLANGT